MAHPSSNSDEMEVGGKQVVKLSETAAHFIKRTDLIEKLEFLQGFVPRSYFDKPEQVFVEGLYEELQDYIDELKSQVLVTDLELKDD